MNSWHWLLLLVCTCTAVPCTQQLVYSASSYSGIADSELRISPQNAPPYGYSISPPLPVGLTFSPTASIQGTPTELAPNQVYTITYMDCEPILKSVTLHIEILNHVPYMSTQGYIMDGTLNSTFFLSLASDVEPAVANGDWLELSLRNLTVESNGWIRGVPNSTQSMDSALYASFPGTDFPGPVRVPFKISLSSPTTSVFYPALACAINTDCSNHPTVSGPPPTNWSLLGNLIPGLSIDPANGTISLHTTTASLMQSIIVAFNATSGLGFSYLTITISDDPLTQVTAISHPFYSLTVGVPFFSAPSIANFGPPAAQPPFTITQPLPPGLSMSTIDGSISGTPFAASTQGQLPPEYTVTSTDGGTSSFRLVVNPAPT